MINLIKLLNFIIKKLNNIIINFNNKNKISNFKILGKYYNKNLDCLKIRLANFNQFEHDELLDELYKFYINNEELIKFSNNKIIIATAYFKDITFNLHPNIYINSNTTLNKFKDMVKSHIGKIYEDGYPIDVIQHIELLI